MCTVYSCLEQTSTKNFYMTKWIIMTVIWCSTYYALKRGLHILCIRLQESAFDCTISKKIKVIHNNRSDTLYCFANPLKMKTIYKNFVNRVVKRYKRNGLAQVQRVQRVHKLADLWNITFCTHWFWGPPELSFIEQTAPADPNF